MHVKSYRFMQALAMSIIVAVLPFALPSITQANEVVIFAIATLGSMLLLGYTGLLSLGQGIFFGVGAYVSGWLGVNLGIGLPVMLIAGLVAGAIVAAVVGFFAIRQKGVYFVMLTLAFAQLFYFLAYSFRDLTGGDNGMPNIPRPPISLFHSITINTTSPSTFYLLCAGLFIVTFVFVGRVVDSPLGATLVAIRENPVRAKAIGNDTALLKLVAFIFSGALTGLAGALYAPFLGLVSLNTINEQMSQSILVMTILSCGGPLAGVLIGPLVFVTLSSWLSSFWPRWPMLIGLLLIMISLSSPDGLMSALSGLFKRKPKQKEVARGDV